MNKLKIYTDNDESFIPTHVEIGNNEIHGVVGITYSQYAGEVPQCTIETHCMPDIDALADIQFRFTPQAVQETAMVLRHNLILDKELYNAFLASIESALKEFPAEMNLYDAAKVIADRIIGEE